MFWIVLAALVLVCLAASTRTARYWMWVRSIKDPEKRMQAEILYRSWKRSGKRLWPGGGSR